MSPQLRRVRRPRPARLMLIAATLVALAVLVALELVLLALVLVLGFIIGWAAAEDLAAARIRAAHSRGYTEGLRDTDPIGPTPEVPA